MSATDDLGPLATGDIVVVPRFTNDFPTEQPIPDFDPWDSVSPIPDSRYHYDKALTPEAAVQTEYEQAAIYNMSQVEQNLSENYFGRNTNGSRIPTDDEIMGIYGEINKHGNGDETMPGLDGPQIAPLLIFAGVVVFLLSRQSLRR